MKGLLSQRGLELHTSRSRLEAALWELAAKGRLGNMSLRTGLHAEGWAENV